MDTGPAIARAAAALLGQVEVSAGVRLLGVSVANLARHAGRQLALDMPEVAGKPGIGPGPSARPPARRDRVPGPDRGVAGPTAGAWDTASRAVDQIRRRFGDGAVGPAVLLGDRGLAVKRRGATQWGPNQAEGDRRSSD